MNQRKEKKAQLIWIPIWILICSVQRSIQLSLHSIHSYSLLFIQLFITWFQFFVPLLSPVLLQKAVPWWFQDCLPKTFFEQSDRQRDERRGAIQQSNQPTAV